MARARRRLSRPVRTTWVIALILGILGILTYLGLAVLAPLRPYAFWLVTAAFALLAVGVMSDGI